jgi:prepilin-type N-terminal cleavage/methylation domain-containing protein
MELLWKRRNVQSPGGFTLLELAVALAVGALLSVILGTVLLRGTNCINSIVTDAVAVEDMKDVVSTVISDLRRSSTTLITIDTSNANWDSMVLQVAGGSPSAKYGAEDETGTFHPNWSIRYGVSGTDLLQETLNPGMAVKASRILSRNVDGLRSGVKGFRVTQNGPLYNVTLRLNKTTQDGSTYQKSMGSTVLVKN